MAYRTIHGDFSDAKLPSKISPNRKQWNLKRSSAWPSITMLIQKTWIFDHQMIGIAVKTPT